jgi:hypothetical protein
MFLVVCAKAREETQCANLGYERMSDAIKQYPDDKSSRKLLLRVGVEEFVDAMYKDTNAGLIVENI